MTEPLPVKYAAMSRLFDKEQLWEEQQNRLSGPDFCGKNKIPER